MKFMLMYYKRAVNHTASYSNSTRFEPIEVEQGPITGELIMIDPKLKVDTKKVDTKEFELPETVFIRDIENKVFQSIVLQCLAQIDG